MFNGVVLALLLLLLLLLAPSAARAQATPAQGTDSGSAGFAVRAMAGWSSAYTGGATGLLAVGLRPPGGLEVEGGIQLFPAALVGQARGYFLGANLVLPFDDQAAVVGGRLMYLDSPSRTSDAVTGLGYAALELGAAGVAVRFEPGIWFGGGQYAIGAGAQFLVGLSWRASGSGDG